MVVVRFLALAANHLPADPSCVGWDFVGAQVTVTHVGRVTIILCIRATIADMLHFVSLRLLATRRAFARAVVRRLLSF